MEAKGCVDTTQMGENGRVEEKVTNVGKLMAFRMMTVTLSHENSVHASSGVIT
jgi:hypothetical protein